MKPGRVAIPSKMKNSPSLSSLLPVLNEPNMDIDMELKSAQLPLDLTEECKDYNGTTILDRIENVGLDDFTNESTSDISSATDIMMIVPKNKNCLVISGGFRNPCPNYSMDEINRSNFNCSIGNPNMKITGQGASWLWGLVQAPEKLPLYLLLLVVFFFVFPWITALIAAGLLYFFMGNRSGNKPSKRTIKWTIQDFSEEIRGGFLTSPQFFDKSGQWRLVVQQKRCIDGVQTTFGLIATDIFPEVEFVTATIGFSCTNQLGHELSTGMKDIKFIHKFECSGDCGYTKPTMFSRRQLGEEDVVNVHCKVTFKKHEISWFKHLLLTFANNGEDSPAQRKRKNSVNEFGTVRPENLIYQNSLSVQMRPLTRFVQHPETKTFAWEIPNFNMLIQSTECWGIFSPQFFVNSHDFCSIWRMKLLELHGVFRLHVQLRGLPRAVRQIKLWYILQLVDSYGDSVVPEHSICRVKYPDHLNLWDTTRHILYRRETMLDRFTSPEGTITLRLSLHLEPNDLPLLEVDSDEWIRPASMALN